MPLTGIMARMDAPNTSPQGSPPPMNKAPHVGEENDIEKNKDIAAFSYLWVMSVIVYFLKRQSPFVKFHSRQAMVLFALSVIVWFVPFINRVLELIVLAGMVLGFVSAAQGQWRDVPLVGPVSRREMTLRQAWQQIVLLIARFGKSAGEMVKKAEKTAEATPPASNSSEPSPPKP